MEYDTLNLLDAINAPGDLLRGAVAGRVGERMAGRDLLRAYGLAGPRDNWGNFLGGMLAEAVVDPMWAIPAVGLMRSAGRAGAQNLAESALRSSIPSPRPPIAPPFNLTVDATGNVMPPPGAMIEQMMPTSTMGPMAPPGVSSFGNDSPLSMVFMPSQAGAQVRAAMEAPIAAGSWPASMLLQSNNWGQRYTVPGQWPDSLMPFTRGGTQSIPSGPMAGFPVGSIQGAADAGDFPAGPVQDAGFPVGPVAVNVQYVDPVGSNTMAESMGLPVDSPSTMFERHGFTTPDQVEARRAEIEQLMDRDRSRARFPGDSLREELGRALSYDRSQSGGWETVRNADYYRYQWQRLQEILHSWLPPNAQRALAGEAVDLKRNEQAALEAYLSRVDPIDSLLNPRDASGSRVIDPGTGRPAQLDLSLDNDISRKAKGDIDALQREVWSLLSPKGTQQFRAAVSPTGPYNNLVRFPIEEMPAEGGVTDMGAYADYPKGQPMGMFESLIGPDRLTPEVVTEAAMERMPRPTVLPEPPDNIYGTQLGRPNLRSEDFFQASLKPSGIPAVNRAMDAVQVRLDAEEQAAQLAAKAREEALASGNLPLPGQELPNNSMTATMLGYPAGNRLNVETNPLAGARDPLPSVQVSIDPTTGEVRRDASILHDVIRKGDLQSARDIEQVGVKIDELLSDYVDPDTGRRVKIDIEHPMGRQAVIDRLRPYVDEYMAPISGRPVDDELMSAEDLIAQFAGAGGTPSKQRMSKRRGSKQARKQIARESLGSGKVAPKQVLPSADELTDANVDRILKLDPVARDAEFKRIAGALNAATAPAREAVEGVGWIRLDDIPLVAERYPNQLADVLEAKRDQIKRASDAIRSQWPSIRDYMASRIAYNMETLLPYPSAARNAEYLVDQLISQARKRSADTYPTRLAQGQALSPELRSRMLADWERSLRQQGASDEAIKRELEYQSRALAEPGFRLALDAQQLPASVSELTNPALDDLTLSDMAKELMGKAGDAERLKLSQYALSLDDLNAERRNAGIPDAAYEAGAPEYQAHQFAKTMLGRQRTGNLPNNHAVGKLLSELPGMVQKLGTLTPGPEFNVLADQLTDLASSGYISGEILRQLNDALMRNGRPGISYANPAPSSAAIPGSAPATPDIPSIERDAAYLGSLREADLEARANSQAVYDAPRMNASRENRQAVWKGVSDLLARAKLGDTDALKQLRILKHKDVLDAAQLKLLNEIIKSPPTSSMSAPSAPRDTGQAYEMSEQMLGGAGKKVSLDTYQGPGWTAATQSQPRGDAGAKKAKKLADVMQARDATPAFMPDSDEIVRRLGAYQARTGVDLGGDVEQVAKSLEDRTAQLRTLNMPVPVEVAVGQHLRATNQGSEPADLKRHLISALSGGSPAPSKPKDAGFPVGPVASQEAPADTASSQFPSGPVAKTSDMVNQMQGTAAEKPVIEPEVVSDPVEDKRSLAEFMLGRKIQNVAADTSSVKAQKGYEIPLPTFVAEVLNVLDSPQHSTVKKNAAAWRKGVIDEIVNNIRNKKAGGTMKGPASKEMRDILDSMVQAFGTTKNAKLREQARMKLPESLRVVMPAPPHLKVQDIQSVLGVIDTTAVHEKKREAYKAIANMIVRDAPGYSALRERTAEALSKRYDDSIGATPGTSWASPDNQEVFRMMADEGYKSRGLTAPAYANRQRLDAQASQEVLDFVASEMNRYDVFDLPKANAVLNKLQDHLRPHNKHYGSTRRYRDAIDAIEDRLAADLGKRSPATPEADRKVYGIRMEFRNQAAKLRAADLAESGGPVAAATPVATATEQAAAPTPAAAAPTPAPTASQAPAPAAAPAPVTPSPAPAAGETILSVNDHQPAYQYLGATKGPGAKIPHGRNAPKLSARLNAAAEGQEVAFTQQVQRNPKKGEKAEEAVQRFAVLDKFGGTARKAPADPASKKPGEMQRKNVTDIKPGDIIQVTDGDAGKPTTVGVAYAKVTKVKPVNLSRMSDGQLAEWATAEGLDPETVARAVRSKKKNEINKDHLQIFVTKYNPEAPSQAAAPAPVTPVNQAGEFPAGPVAQPESEFPVGPVSSAPEAAASDQTMAAAMGIPGNQPDPAQAAAGAEPQVAQGAAPTPTPEAAPAPPAPTPAEQMLGVPLSAEDVYAMAGQAIMQGATAPQAAAQVAEAVASQGVDPAKAAAIGSQIATEAQQQMQPAAARSGMFDDILNRLEVFKRRPWQSAYHGGRLGMSAYLQGSMMGTGAVQELQQQGWTIDQNGRLVPPASEYPMMQEMMMR